MASCYHCGKSGADYRRTVTTGFSRSNWVSKRSYGSGTRTNYSLRSLCENCAISVDKSNAISSAVIAIIVFCGLIYYIFIKR
jgi:hypothetical protein